jgi:hypothetical protein
MPWLSVSWGRRGSRLLMGLPLTSRSPYRVHGLTSVSKVQRWPLTRASRGVPEVFETPQDEASLFHIGPGPVTFSKGARHEFFKKCRFGIGDRP